MELTTARQAAKTALESLLDGTCIITGYTTAQDSTTKETILSESVLYSGVCRLSQTTAAAKQSESADNIDYDALLFLPAGAAASAGAKISVTQNGVSREFEQAGDPAVYATHTEVKIKRVARA